MGKSKVHSELRGRAVTRSHHRNVSSSFRFSSVSSCVVKKVENGGDENIKIRTNQVPP